MHTLIKNTISRINAAYPNRFSSIFDSVLFEEVDWTEVTAYNVNDHIISYGHALLKSENMCYFGLVHMAMMIEGKYSERPEIDDTINRTVWNIAAHLTVVEAMEQMDFVIPDVCLQKDIFEVQLDVENMTVDEIYEAVYPEVIEKMVDAEGDEYDIDND